MIQATKLRQIAGTNTYEPTILHLRIVSSSVGEEEFGAVSLAAGERTVQAARGLLDLSDLVTLPDGETYRVTNIEALPPFFATVEATLERQPGGAFLTRPFRLSRLTDELGNFLTDSSGNRLAGW